MRVAPVGDRVVHQIRARRGEHHHHAHHEDPDEQLDLHADIGHRQHDERDERDAGDAVGLEAVRRRADRVAGVVARAVGDDARVARIVFLDLEDDLHQVRSDVGDLREDAAGDPQRRGAERFADGEAEEAHAGVFAGNEQQNREHEQQLDRDEHHADAHARLQRDVAHRERLAAKAGKRRARVGQRVDADAVPRHAVAAADADQAEEQDDDDLVGLESGQREVGDHDGADEAPRE